MKNRIASVAMFLLALVSTGSAVSLIAIHQVRGDASSASGSVAVTSPNSSASAWAKVGANCSITAGVFNCASTVSAPSWAAEVPAGTINGTNTVFTLSATPIANSQVLYYNGQAIFPAAGDYTISGPSVTLVSPPSPGDTLIAVYQH